MMEGPSLYLAAEQLQPFVRKTIASVSGNTKFGKERLHNKKVLDIFSWGKHLLFQFDEFALRVHFMLYGSFEATVDGTPVTGDYKRQNRASRLTLIFPNGEIIMFSCSVKYIEGSDVKSTYDFKVNVMSEEWDPKVALKKSALLNDLEIADVLLDQDIFAGVGNIIKNEVLHQAFVHPESRIKDLPAAKLKEIVKRAQDYSWDFYKWRKIFELKKHYQVYRQSVCKRCGEKVQRKVTGSRNRLSFVCPNCQKLPKN
ncbi:MAG: endonuclease [Candidatus Doudnabacteria bacterium]|nr:endonuclease [Candidatus Doudnabacteria bacterium]